MFHSLEMLEHILGKDPGEVMAVSEKNLLKFVFWPAKTSLFT